MCGRHGTADELLAVHEAAEVAEELLGPLLRDVVTKALDLGSAKGFDRAVALLAGKLRRAAGPVDADAVRAAVEVLDVDWSATTAPQRSRLLAEATTAARRATAIVPARIQSPFDEAATSVIEATRTEARRGQRLAIAADLNALDRRIARHVTGSQANFVRDEYGRRAIAFGEQARRIVADGLEQGLGRDDIAAALERSARTAFIERQPFYWEVVAGAFVGQGRSFAQMSSYAEASISRYRIEAVLDERTTPMCQFLHGKEFSVGDALRRFEQVEQLQQPEDVKMALPWVHQRLDQESGRQQLYVNGASGQAVIAEITRSAAGTRDDRGEFRAFTSNAELMDLGVSFPPYHGLCRTTTLAVV